MYEMMTCGLMEARDGEDVPEVGEGSVSNDGEIALLIGQSFTLPEVAQKLGCKLRTVQTHVASRELVAVDVGCGRERRSLRVFEEDLEGFIKRRRIGAESVTAPPRNRIRPKVGTIDRIEPGGFAEGRAARAAARMAREARNG